MTSQPRTETITSATSVDERRRVLQHTYVARQVEELRQLEPGGWTEQEEQHARRRAEERAANLLAHPVVQGLPVEDFTKLADSLGGEVDWFRFVTTWEAYDAAGREPTVRDVVEHCLASAFAVFNELGDHYFPPLESVRHARERVDYYQALVRLGDAFGIDTPAPLDQGQDLSLLGDGSWADHDF